MNLDNSYARLPEGFYALVEPHAAAAPTMLAWNNDLAAELGLDSLAKDEVELAKIFSGSSLPAGVQPIALAYAGHQFGYFVPQLGDGRAALLGEVVTDAGERYDIQLKGSGASAYFAYSGCSTNGRANTTLRSLKTDRSPATAACIACSIR